jgi:hypothetical protein
MSFRKFAIPTLALAAFLIVGGSPARADTLCAAGSYSALEGTTCDIGSLQFTFGSIVSRNYLYDAYAGYLYDSQWTASDISFTPTASGFSVGLANFDSQSITAPLYGQALDYLYFPFSVTALGGPIIRTTASGGTPSVDNRFDNAISYQDYVVLSNTTSYQQTSSYKWNSYGTTYSEQYEYNIGSISSGSGSAYPFYLEAEDGGTASISGTTATFTFVTTPEPATCLIAGIALVALGLIGRKRRLNR